MRPVLAPESDKWVTCILDQEHPHVCDVPHHCSFPRFCRLCDECGGPLPDILLWRQVRPDGAMRVGHEACVTRPPSMSEAFTVLRQAIVALGHSIVEVAHEMFGR